MAATYGFIGDQALSTRTDSSKNTENIAYWVDVSFVETGAYTNVDKDDVDYTGRELGKFTFVDDRVYGSGYVYQSEFKNWVYESGINYPAAATPPVICSGIWIENEFLHKANATGTMAYHIDYPNGRIIFEQPDAIEDVYGSGSVNLYANFSYKRVTILFDEDEEKFATISSATNPAGSGAEFPTEVSISLPAVAISESRKSWSPRGLGGGKIGKSSVNCHVYANDNSERNAVCDILVRQENKKIPTIDWNSSESPLDEWGDINPSFSGVYDAATYFPDSQMYLLKANYVRSDESVPEGVVIFDTESYTYR